MAQLPVAQTQQDYYDNLTKEEIPKSIVCDQAEFDAVHDFGSTIDKSVIRKGVRYLTPCNSSTWGENKTPGQTGITPQEPTITPSLNEDEFLKRLFFKNDLDSLSDLKDISLPTNISDVIKDISDLPNWSDFIKNNYSIYSAYRPSLTRPCLDLNFKSDKSSIKTMEEVVERGVKACSGINIFSDENYWKTSYIQKILNDKAGITGDIFLICDVAKGNIKQDLYFADRTKAQTFYWLQTPQTIFDPAGKTTWSSGKEYGFRDADSRFKFAWQTAETGKKINYLYPKWDIENKEWSATIKRTDADSNEKQICSNTNSYMITTSDQDKQPHTQTVSFYIQQPNTTKYVYADNKTAAKSSINNISKVSSTDYVNSAQKYILSLISFLKNKDNLDQQKTQQLIANYTEAYMMMAKRFGDASQAAACCQLEIPYNIPSDEAYQEKPNELNDDKYVDGQQRNTNGNHALVTYDRLCVATGLMFLSPIVVYSLDNGFIVFTRKDLSSIETKINNFFTMSLPIKLKSEELIKNEKEVILQIIPLIKNNKIGEWLLTEIKERIEKICDIDTDNYLTMNINGIDQPFHIQNWLKISKDKKMPPIKPHKDLKKSRNESIRLFVGLIFSFSKYLLDIEELEKSYEKLKDFLKTSIETGSGSFLTGKIAEVKSLYEDYLKDTTNIQIQGVSPAGHPHTRGFTGATPQYPNDGIRSDKTLFQIQSSLLMKLTTLDDEVNQFIKQIRLIKVQNDILVNEIKEMGLMSEDIDTHDKKIALLQKIIPDGLNENLNTFNLFDGIQSRLTARISATIGSFKRGTVRILKGGLNLSDVDKKLDHLKQQSTLNLTQINKAMSLDTLILPTWREIKKTNHSVLIDMYKQKIYKFYKDVFDAEFNKPLNKLTSRELNKKVLAEQGLDILQRELSISNSITGTQPASSLQTGGLEPSNGREQYKSLGVKDTRKKRQDIAVQARKTKRSKMLWEKRQQFQKQEKDIIKAINLDNLITKLYPIILYQKITSLALGNMEDTTFFLSLQDERREITYDMLQTLFENYLFKKRNINLEELQEYQTTDDTPYVIHITNTSITVDENGYANMISPLYTYEVHSSVVRGRIPSQEISETTPDKQIEPFLEEIYVGKQYANKQLEIPMYMILYNIPEKYFKQDKYSFINFSYLLPTYYYVVDDTFDGSIKIYKQLLKRQLKLKENKSINYSNVVDKIKFERILNNLYKRLQKVWKIKQNTYEEYTTIRNNHRIFLEEYQLLDTYSSIKQACENEDIPILLREYFKYKNNIKQYGDDEFIDDYTYKLFSIFNDLTKDDATIYIDENNKIFWDTFMRDILNNVILKNTDEIDTETLSYKLTEDTLYDSKKTSAENDIIRTFQKLQQDVAAAPLISVDVDTRKRQRTTMQPLKEIEYTVPMNDETYKIAKQPRVIKAGGRKTIKNKKQ